MRGPLESSGDPLGIRTGSALPGPAGPGRPGHGASPPALGHRARMPFRAFCQPCAAVLQPCREKSWCVTVILKFSSVLNDFISFYFSLFYFTTFYSVLFHSPSRARMFPPETSVMWAPSEARTAAGAKARSSWREKLARTGSPRLGAPARPSHRAAWCRAELRPRPSPARGPQRAAAPGRRVPERRVPGTAGQPCGLPQHRHRPPMRTLIGWGLPQPAPLLASPRSKVPAGPEGCGRQRGGVGHWTSGEG